MEVVQATKLRAICACDLEQAGKFVNGQWYSLSKASLFYIGMDSSVVPLGDSGYSLVQTIDYFYPSVEDPYIAGKIACANVLSDLYALGVTRCDNVLMITASSTKLTEKQRDIVVPLLIRGVKDLAEQAGTRVTGGETMLNPWPMIGGVASSVCRESEIIS
ncbi:hypothetical protein V5799_014941 [Amblyomma americanum]|uniref:PurM-like N-terminal domain-containing protein n=1 Tax=Amblyomma americanum TaxID=6943 RepID=A0AAQ4E1K5_AMBAM